jgi:predicted RNase H-like HicB family nuclease
VNAELTTIIEEAPEGEPWALCPDVPGAKGQGESIEKAKQSAREAIRLIFECRVADMKRGLPGDALEAVIAI